MRTGTYNRYQNLWFYTEKLQTFSAGPGYETSTFRLRDVSVDSCHPGSGMWSLAEIANRLANRIPVAGGEPLTYGPSESVGWPRQSVIALGPSGVPGTDTTTLNPARVNALAAEPVILTCITDAVLAASAKTPTDPVIGTDCSPVSWFGRFGVQWEQAENADAPWQYVPAAELNIYGNRLAIGQATAQTTGAASEIITQFYGIIDSVRISRGTTRYTGDSFIPYNSHAPEADLIDDNVVFALNLGDDPTRLPGKTDIRYYVKNRGWLTPSQSTEGLVPIPLDVAVTVAVTQNIAWPPTGINITGEPAQVVIDGYGIQVTNVVLLTNQTDSAQNGLWQVLDDDTGWTWSRVTQRDDGAALALRYGHVVTPTAGAANNGKSFYLLTPDAAGTNAIDPAAAQVWGSAKIIPDLRTLFLPAEDAETAQKFADRHVLAYSNLESGFQHARPGIMFPAHEDFGAEVKQALYLSDAQLFAPDSLNKPNVVSVDLATVEPLAAVDYLLGPKAIDGDDANTDATLNIVLIKNQRDARENGIYSAGTATDGPAALWTRFPIDADPLLTQSYFKVEDGDTLVETNWYATTAPAALGTAPLYFKQDEILGLYRDDFCIEAIFKVAGFLHPAVKTTPTSGDGDHWPSRYGQNMTLLDTYRRIGEEVNTGFESGVRIHFYPEDGAHNGRVFVDVGPYAMKQTTTVNGAVSAATSSDEAGGVEWKGPALQSDVIHAGRFYHVAVTRRRGVIRLYVDGVLQDQLYAQARTLPLVDRTTAQNEIRYRAKAYLGPWLEDKTPYIQCIVRSPEFYYNNDNSTPDYTKLFNGTAGMFLAPENSIKTFLNLPANWPQNNSEDNYTATWPGKPIPAYPAPAHVYIVNNLQDTQPAGIKWTVTPSVRFPADTIYADLATVDENATNGLDPPRPIIGRGALSLVGLSTFINREPPEIIATTLTADTGLSVLISATQGQTVTVTTGAITIFNALAHGLSAGDTVVFRFDSETTDGGVNGTERVIDTITHATPATTFNLIGHGFSIGDRVIFRTAVNGLAPTGLVANRPYFISSDNYTADTFSVALTSGGPSISTSIASAANAADVYVSLVLNGLTPGAQYTVLETGLSLNTFSVAPEPGGAAISTYGPVTGQLRVASQPATFFTDDEHNLTVGQAVVFKRGAPDTVLPVGITENRPYFVIADTLSDTAFRVSESVNGPGLYVTGSRSGAVVVVRAASTFSSAALTVNEKFTFQSNVQRIIAAFEKIVYIADSLQNGSSDTDTPVTIVGTTEDLSETSTNVDAATRVYTFNEKTTNATVLQLLVSVGSVYSRGTIIAFEPTTEFPSGILPDVYYYVTAIAGTTCTFSETLGGPPVYGYKTGGATSVKIVKAAFIDEVPRYVDGVPVVEGMRILVKNQQASVGEQDAAGTPDAGVYFASVGPWVRVPELSTAAQIKNSLRVFVYGGFINSNNGFLLDMTSDGSPAKDILPRNYAIDVTPLLFKKDTNVDVPTESFEAYLETNRAAGGDPRRYAIDAATGAALSRAAAFAAPAGVLPGTFVTEDGRFYVWPKNAHAYVNEQPNTANALLYWIEQAEEDLNDAVSVVLDQPFYFVDAFTTTNVALAFSPVSASVDGVSFSPNDTEEKIIFVRKQANPAENGLYVLNKTGAWSRDPNFALSSDFFDGLYIVPKRDSGANVVASYNTVAFKLNVPADFELGVSALTCHVNPTPVDGADYLDGDPKTVVNLDYYDNEIFRLTKIHLPIKNWKRVEDQPPIEPNTGLPLTTGDELTFETAVTIGGGGDDDLSTFRIRTRCAFAGAESDVIGRYIVWRVATAVGISSNIASFATDPASY